MNYYPQNQNYMTVPVPTSNKIFVASKEDALSRYANPNSIMIYVLQDESMLFEIVTDMLGKKTIKERKLIDIIPQEQKQVTNTEQFVSKSEFDDFRAKIESVLNNTKKKVVNKDDEQ